VILAIIDTGVDFRNPDFVTLDAKGRPVSRLLYLWDTQSRAFDEGKGGTRPPLSYPNGASFGTVYTRAQLTAELRATSISIPTTDEDGHGTACAGVAAGNGRNAPGRPGVVGVAPEADIVAVRVGGDVEFLLNAIVDWLDQVRGRQPLVVSLSMGGQLGGHDGMRVAERALSARFPLESRGRAVLIAAGNEGTEALHAAFDLTDANTRKELGWRVAGRTRLQIYADVPDPSLIRFSTKGGSELSVQAVEWSRYREPGHIVIQGSVSGEGSWLVSSPTGRPIRIDAYMQEGRAHHERAFTRGAVREAMVATPGTAERAITVGAYIWNEQFDRDGQIITVQDYCGGTPLWIGDRACYSNPGFSRSGSVKPEILAPSDVFSASRARAADGTGLKGDWIVDGSGNYVQFRGTSAATPYAAGVVALAFQKNPQLSLARLRELLAEHATQNGFTQATPNRFWGYGKLDLAAIDRLIAHAK
jgi:subtilisin family serine protease